MKYIKFTLLVIFLIHPDYLLASIKSKIIQNFEDTNNLSFEFKQNINEEIEQGQCVIEYPKKIFCEYKNFKRKILVSNGKKLVIKNLTNNQYYIYPIEKTAFNLILDKEFLIEKMRKNKGEMIDSKYFRFKFLEGDYQINIFFDKVTYDIIGWQNVDIYQNLVITYLFNLQKNINIEKNKFRLPSQDYN